MGKLPGKPLGLTLVGLISLGFNQIPMTPRPKIENIQGTPRVDIRAIGYGEF
jgi:hypothetical protein